MNADGTKIKKILRAGSKIGARAIEKQIINLPQPKHRYLLAVDSIFGCSFSPLKLIVSSIISLFSYISHALFEIRCVKHAQALHAFCASLCSYPQVEIDYATREAGISEYPLSGALACTKVCTGAEMKWNIL